MPRRVSDHLFARRSLPSPRWRYRSRARTSSRAGWSGAGARMANRQSLTRLEGWFPFFQESTHALAIVFGIETGEAFVPFLRRELCSDGEALDELLVPSIDQRRALRDALRERVGFRLDLVVRHDAIDETLAQRLLCAEHSSFEKDFQRNRAAGEGEQPHQLAVAHGEPEPVDRNTEAARFTADTQIAHRGDLQPTTDARALDERHRRMPAAPDRLHRLVDEVAIGFRLLRIGALRGELGNVRAGGERLFAGTAQHDTTEALVG